MAETIVISLVMGLGLVLAFTLIVIRWGLKFEERKLALKAGQGETGRLEHVLNATQTEVAKLRERVQVLEKLVTDDDRKLASDIERLRASDDARR
jgi:predicted nuclease with TOPRIM domain